MIDTMPQILPRLSARGLALLCALLCALAAAPPAAAQSDYSALFESSSPSVVSVNSVTVLQNQADPFPFFFGLPNEDDGIDSPFRTSGIGSGVIITADGYIMTNAHVILSQGGEVVDNIEIVTHDKKKHKAQVVGHDVFSDIALLKIEAAAPLPTATIGNSDDIKVGNIVLAIGHPLGLNYTLTQGVISSLNRSIGGGNGSERFVPFIQTDAAINPGNSGGPLLNTRGEVIGINSRIIGGRSGSFIGYSLAIPINLAMEVQAKLRQDGQIRRGMLGVTFDAKGIDEDDAKVWGLAPGTTGVLVNSVIEDSGAAAAGIEPGDIIISFDGKPIKEAFDFPRFIADTEPGSEVPIELIRQGERMTLSATIGSIDDGGKLAAAKPPVEKIPYGMVLNDLDAETARAAEFDHGAVLVGFDDDNGQRSIPQELFKLRAGDIILGVIISGKLSKVENASALREILATLSVDTIGFQIIRGNNRRPFFVTVSLD